MPWELCCRTGPWRPQGGPQSGQVSQSERLNYQTTGSEGTTAGFGICWQSGKAVTSHVGFGYKDMWVCLRLKFICQKREFPNLSGPDISDNTQSHIRLQQQGLETSFSDLVKLKRDEDWKITVCQMCWKMKKVKSLCQRDSCTPMIIITFFK